MSRPEARADPGIRRGGASEDAVCPEVSSQARKDVWNCPMKSHGAGGSGELWPGRHVAHVGCSPLWHTGGAGTVPPTTGTALTRRKPASLTLVADLGACPALSTPVTTASLLLPIDPPANALCSKDTSECPVHSAAPTNTDPQRSRQGVMGLCPLSNLPRHGHINCDTFSCRLSTLNEKICKSQEQDTL